MMKEEALNEFVDFVIQERMQRAFSRMKDGKELGREDEIERKYQEAVALLPPDKEQAIREYCDAIFDSGADAEQFFIVWALRMGFGYIRLLKISLRNYLRI